MKERAWSGGDTDLPHRLELYPASEGFIAMQDTAGDPGMRLCSDQGNFFEFVPLEEINESNPRRGLDVGKSRRSKSLWW